ncbi:MAG: gas vesicle protein K [Desulfobaccales bacterium]
MKTVTPARVESEALSDFARIMQRSLPLPAGRASNGYAPADAATPRLNLDPDSQKNSLARLVLTLVKLIHELLERQGLRRIDAGALSEAEVERLGLTLMQQAQELERLRREFGLDEADLNLDLGPLGKLL